ncbi:ABC transporter substrate-binding protein SapA [Salinimonas sediminis]|uniref:Peptide ABC transporter substrate-binding protein SapA n=1 Tax=Salinimonas sediminis TaxID=2303538 RepID=A0A346NJU5_9ALTE|nr:ABC transporter substrate-binding protein SapA [Salinimonas sediminis]AXR05802.1 peptide ABC transporter substrate-binding protein SapA [Salinimonas sediminis]
MNSLPVLLICLATLVGISACSKQKKDGFYQTGIMYCSESNPVNFNPQLDTSATTSDATSHQIYDRLLDFDPDSGTIVPSLATSWSVSDDGLTYTFQLRREVAFHTTDYFTPQRTFNADDVIFSINRWRLPQHPYHQVSGGRYPYFESLGLAENIREVNRINGYRIEILLTQRDSSFLANLATDFSVILSQEYADKLMEDGAPQRLDHYPIGTGPFQFESYRKDHYIRYRAHHNYWGQTEFAERLIYDITPKSSLRLAKLITGECDAIAFPAQTELDIIRNREELELAEKPGLNVGFWAFNTQRPPFDNPNVRRALAYAIDKNTLLEAVYFDSATRARNLLPAASWAYQNDAEDTAYNPVMARKLLKEAGVEAGFTMTIWAMPIERAYNPNAAKMAELIQGYLADVGVNVTIVTYDWTTFRRHLREGLHDSVLIGWSADNGDPDNFFRPLLSCGAIPSGTNRAMWCNKKYDALINEALQTEDLFQRKAIYEQVNSLLFKELPIVPIAHAFRYQAFRKELKGMQINPYGGVRFGGVTKQL